MADIFWAFPPDEVIEWPGARGGDWDDHIGTDWPVLMGTRLRATMSGIVDIIWNDGLGAWVIDIYAPDGTVIRNGHLSEMSPRDGQWVNAGDDIGATGGRPGTAGAGLSTGDHFHWEIRNNGGWGAYGWYDPRDLDIKNFDTPAALNPLTDIAALALTWEDTLYHFSRTATRTKNQIIKAGVLARVTFNDKGDVSMAQGPGDVIGLSATVRVKGTPGGRVEFTLVKETVEGKINTKTVRVSQERAIIDSLGLASVSLPGSTPLTGKQRMRLLVQGSNDAGALTVERFEISGYARAGAK